MTTFGILFVQKTPVKDGYQNFVQNCTVREVKYGVPVYLNPFTTLFNIDEGP